MMAGGGIERKRAHKITKRNNDIFRLIAATALLPRMDGCEMWYDGLL